MIKHLIRSLSKSTKFWNRSNFVILQNALLIYFSAGLYLKFT